MATDQDEEELAVEKTALCAGVKLQAGRKVTLLVGGLKAGPATSKSKSGDSDATGEGNGPGSGSSSAGAGGSGAAGAKSTGAGVDATTAGGAGTTDATGSGSAATGGTSPDTAPEPKAQPDAEPDVTPSSHGALDAAHFETDKAFPLPPALAFFRGVATFANRHAASVLLVVGHTDAVGSAAYNLGLAGDRARSAAAYLRVDADAWAAFYSHPTSSARWGEREDQHMLSALPFGGTPYLKGPVDGNAGPATKAALQLFQADAGLQKSGKADAATRKALITAYQSAEGTTIPASMDLQTLACGARHLEVETQADEPRNRRVDVFAFQKGPIKPAPAECTSGQHPGCKVYDQWKKSVVGPIPPGGDTPPPKPGGVLEGTIVYRDGSAAAGVPVIAVLPDGSKKGAFTDKSGHYRIEGVSGSAQLRLADGLPLAADPSQPGELLVAVSATGGGDGPVVA